MARISRRTSPVCGRAMTRTAAVLLATSVTAGGLLLATPAANASPRAGSVAATVSATGCQRTLSNYPTVWPGDRGPAVSTLQCVLNDAGFGPVVVDGWYGPQTRAAVLRIASGTEGPVDTSGRVGRALWTGIISAALTDRTLRNGSTGADVLTLQRALRAQGCTIAVDGRFGPQTVGVVKNFQRATDNVPDGVVGEVTRFALRMWGANDWNCP